MSDNIQELTDENFDQTLSDTSLPLLIDFWAPWCGPCRALAPILLELSQEMSAKLAFAKINVELHQEAPSKYNVRTIPCLIVFKGGQEIGRLVGHKGKNVLIEELEKIL
ncbi:MAG: thioredoxin [Deltaproteobacteria bacterium]|jgi:thioredoxin 1|nr:thioredoxin [Deltaproteobacteria bacterium]